ncbi:MAG: threonine--tRNA ligase [Candidatus Yanofskybacteria bacterium RIFCSPHIGHO2_01_FULL_43_42]|uniref:Threonine--tRNA ligase n=1 Tax=Candidatus Yanofskybacteria bacterium RIFCSPLOWO2_01_FULL_43_22 TaxID=1802695 RepID=A0A1F8GI39_9BACT|nr:MAG: threonine--tRNA ligase [Candidatus Yanofskybacteria bacterium RIFCSPHIGHO2_01_FULL_43_42]OGN13342.1 MAG: threonine--tRNA ligase [Candidatus Yanofskybacteria bacterium RIFCSPHIGHO2_02_FULL_43_17]OGN24388.1 MAG: threonine--tRNA ligase [Candidatus Yanofskybacteria bacterium RIFCSPLOWO2_01_FULL_43_22]
MAENNIEYLRHSLAHLLGAAVLELYPGSKLAIGPSIENGFYYDVDMNGKLSDDDLPQIEKKMREILKTWNKFEEIEETKDSAQSRYIENQYKNELIRELAEKEEKITSYKSGDFVDLCRGGHVTSAKDINPEAFKLSHVAGAYWRGNEKNPQLTRIYGFAFTTKKELNDYLAMLEEAKKRDHKKLGIELDLFTFSELVGPGLPLWTPKGTLLRNILDDYVWSLRKKRDYQQVDIPHITKKDLYEISGHWDKFKDELFKIETREGHIFAMKPMNCPHHTQIYARKPHSYRELPQRYANTTKDYRDEQTGELSGLSRVRAFTQDDAHVFCRMSQVKEEFLKIWDIVHEFYGAFGLALEVRLSRHDPEHPEKYLGDKDNWQKAEKVLQDLIKEKNVRAIDGLGEAAFYGPKLDFMAKDSLGRQWQVATIQLDMNMPERFDLTCANEKGEKERIVMIHAAIMGSIERFLSIIIEHYAGAFPVWLSPVQAMILPISDKQNRWAESVRDKLKEAGLRAEVDLDNETLGKKIRQAELQKVPYVLVVGEKEVEAKAVAVRQRGSFDKTQDKKGDIGQMKLDKFIDKILKEIETKKS